MSQAMESQFNFRMSSDDRHLIEEAAHFLGLKPNTYARKRLREAAYKDLQEAFEPSSLRLNSKDWAQFIQAMEAPVKINSKLRSAAKKFQKHASC